jgi:hypothetical protein
VVVAAAFSAAALATACAVMVPVLGRAVFSFLLKAPNISLAY